VSARRNIAGYPFPSIISRAERREIEAILVAALNGLGNKLKGRRRWRMGWWWERRRRKMEDGEWSSSSC